MNPVDMKEKALQNPSSTAGQTYATLYLAETIKEAMKPVITIKKKEAEREAESDRDA